MSPFSPVSVVWPVLLFGLGVAALVGVGLSVRRRRWVRGAAAGVVAVVMAAGGVVAVVNIRFDYYRTWGDLLLGPHGRDVAASSASLAQIVALAPPPVTGGVASPSAGPSINPKTRSVVAGAVRDRHGLLVQVNIPGPAAHIRSRGAWVYLPAAYFSTPAVPVFPVLELFHGVPGGPRTWLTVLHVQDDLDRLIGTGQMPPSIVIMPTDNPSRLRSQECQDSPLALDETYLSADVRAWAARALPRASTGRWGVGGYSTGAYCALLLMLHRPQDYAAAAGVDGYYHAIDTFFARGLYRSAQQRLANSPDWLWAHARPALPVQLLIMQGTRDEDYGHAQAFRRELVTSPAPGLTLVSVDNPGAEHTARSWRTFDPLMVAWLARTVATGLTLPTTTYPPLPLGHLVLNPLSTGPDLLGPVAPARIGHRPLPRAHRTPRRLLLRRRRSSRMPTTSRLPRLTM